MRTTITDFMSAASAIGSLHSTIHDRILQGVLGILAASDDKLADIQIAEFLDEPERSKMLKYQQCLRDKIVQHFNPGTYFSVAERALTLEPVALDIACRVIIENIIPEHIINKDCFLKIANDLIMESGIDPGPEALLCMQIEFGRSFAEYQQTHYRMIAGPIFGLELDAFDIGEFRANKQRLLDNAYSAGIHHSQQKPDPREI